MIQRRGRRRYTKNRTLGVSNDCFLVSWVRSSLKKSAGEPTGVIMWPTAQAVGPGCGPSPAKLGRGNERGWGHFSQGFRPGLHYFAPAGAAKGPPA